MLDYQRIVDDVRSALFNNGQDAYDLLQGVAADYALAIDEANERLRQCGALLRKGLRSEALQLCEVEPNILDVVGILDFPERDSWKELLALHSLAPPAALMLDVAANLNEAYAIEQPLATLLQRHRLLAMSRAPIRLRLETLRSLADADPESQIWDQDVQIFEQERVKELQRDVPQAIAGGDPAALNALSAELENAVWRIERPDGLIAQIVAARTGAARQQGLGELRRAVESLTVMHIAFDVDGGRRVRTQWDRLFAAWGRFADVSLLAEATPALEWLREQDDLAAQTARHEAALAALEQAVTARRSTDELHRLHQEAKREGEIPAALETGYRERLEAIDRAARRNLRLSLTIFGLFILVIGGIVALVVYQHMQADKLERAVAKLQQLVKDDNRDEARNFIDQLMAESPQIAADPRIQEINSHLTKDVRDEDGRRRALATAMELLQKSIADKLPDKDALARAKKLAKTEDENTAIRKAEQDIDKLDSEVKSKIDRDFLAQLKDLKTRVDAVEKDAEDKPDAGSEKLKALALEISNLLTLHSQISEAARNPAELLKVRIKALDDGTRSVNDRLDREEAITLACGDNATLRQKLLEYADKFPQARRSASFRAVANDESPLWDWIGQWNAIVQAVGRRNPAKLSRKAAADAASKLRKLLDQRSGYPDAEAFRQRLPFMDAVVARIDAEGNPIEAALKPVFADPLLAGVWMLKDRSGQKYYLLEDPRAKFGAFRTTSNYGIQYVAGFDLSKKIKSLRGEEIVADQLIAPQRATARALTSILDALSDDQWEPSFCRMIETVMNDRDSDPLLRHFLLRKIVTVGCQGSLCLQRGFAGYADLLKNSKVPPNVNWVDPNNAEAAEQRPLAEAELHKLPSFSEAQLGAANQFQSLAKAVGTELTCVGWLRKTQAGNWQCLLKPGCPQTGKLATVRTAQAAGQSNAAIFELVGRLEGGKAVIDGSGPALAEGRPVFAGSLPPK